MSNMSPLQTDKVTPIFIESVTGGYSTQAQNFTESIPSLGRRGLELYSGDCEGMNNHWNFKKTIKSTHLQYYL